MEVKGVEPEAPIPSSVKKGKQTKKQKREGKGTASEPPKTKSKENGALSKPEEDPEAVRKAKAEKKRGKKERKKTKEEAKAVKAKAKKGRTAQEAALEEDSEAATGVLDASDEEDDDDAQGGEIDHIDMEDILEESRDHPSSTATPSTARSPAFDASANHSGSSSISSIAAPTTEEPQPKGSTEPQTDSQLPKPDPSELKARLAQRIEDLRKSRHADGPDGAPARTRQELIESRRQKEEARRAHKKELRQKAKEEERQKQADTLARGSLLLSGSPLLSPGSPLTPSSEPNNFSFNRIAFSNGQHASANLDAIIDPKTRAKGPSDPHTALLAAQKKAARLNGLDESKRADISEKDTWLNARKRAHGERIRDDTSLLKKTLKRKEKQKKKSEKEWTERIEGLKKGQDIRQKKREANIQKRKEDKGGKGKKSKGAKKGKPKARPGFEGSFRAKAPTPGARRR